MCIKVKKKTIKDGVISTFDVGTNYKEIEINGKRNKFEGMQ